jgi:hypothetical protein
VIATSDGRWIVAVGSLEMRVDKHTKHHSRDYKTDPEHRIIGETGVISLTLLPDVLLPVYDIEHQEVEW